MRNKRFVNLLCYSVICLIAISFLVCYIATRFFGLNQEIFSLVRQITFYLCIGLTALSAFVYSTSRRNIVFSVLLLIAICVIIFVELM